MIQKVGEKLWSDLVIFPIFSSDTLLGFHDSIRVALLKYLMYFLDGINTKYFPPLRILNLFIKSFVDSFVDFALTFFHSLFNSFLFGVTSFSLF